MIYTMDDEVTGVKGSYADLLKPEYGGVEIYGEEWELLKEMLGVSEATEIIFTCDEDGNNEDHERFIRVLALIRTLPELRTDIDWEANFTMYELDGVKLVVTCNGIYTIFIKAVDREKFDEITNKL